MLHSPFPIETELAAVRDTALPDDLGPQAMAHARADLFRQAQAACVLGSPFVRDVLAAASRQLHRAPLLALRLMTWPGDRAAAALAMRVNGALHHLARSGTVAELSAVYATQSGDIDRAVAAAFIAADADLARFIATPTQTNAVARSSALAAAMMVVAARFDQPLELLELGASAGLNLNLARYAHRLGGTAAGDAAADLHLAPRWIGPAPRRHVLAIADARGVDLAPLDPADAEACERLSAFVWADRPDRMGHLHSAIRIARRHPVRVDRGDAADWLEARLAWPQAVGVTRVVFHSMLRQYLAPATRNRIDRTLATAGARADMARPLAHVSYEWNPARTSVDLVLTTWPHGETRLLAHPDPYGDQVTWLG